MSKKHAFQQIIQDAKQVFKVTRPGPGCPTSDVLIDYVYQELAQEETDNITTHLDDCEACKMVLMRIEADQLLWNKSLEEKPEATLSQALGSVGRQEVRLMMRRAAGKQAGEHPAFASKIKESMIAWISPIWQPLYAGEAVTAADLEEQDTSFEMDYGEYINLSCHWQDEKDDQPRIELSWQANLFQPSRLWARFINPDTSTVITEILLGSALEGRISIPGNQLTFNPTVDKWAIAIIVEDG
jgi:hypothetical protein